MIKLFRLLMIVGIMIFMCGNMCFAAEEKITLISVVSNVSNNVSNTFTYKIEPEETNENDGLKEPKIIEVKFDDVVPNSNNEAIVAYDIDFSDINYGSFGTYKYIVTEEESEDSEDFPVSDEKYEIYVQIMDDGNGKTLKIVYGQALDLEANEKSDLVFNHESKKINDENNQTNENTEKDPNTPKTGVFVNVLPFIALAAMGILGIVLVVKSKKNDDE